MASSYGLRERASEDKTKQKEEKPQEGAEGGAIKKTKKPESTSKKGDFRGAKYDSRGIHKETQKDLCDCLTIDCPGCFLPCPKCSSPKCGHECRCNRKWIYESFEIEGTSLTVQKQIRK